MSSYETHVSKFLQSTRASEERVEHPARPGALQASICSPPSRLLARDWSCFRTRPTRDATPLFSLRPRPRFDSARIPILIEENRGDRPLLPSADLKRSQRRWLGQIILQLYFAQLFQSDTTVIDLWPSRLGIDAEGDAIWNPRPVYLRWDSDFLAALRDVYAGFFLDDESRFERGIRQLGLGSAGGLLLRHLGHGNQRGVRFSSSHLQSTLREISELRLGSTRRTSPKLRRLWTLPCIAPRAPRVPRLHA